MLWIVSDVYISRMKIEIKQFKNYKTLALTLAANGV